VGELLAHAGLPFIVADRHGLVSALNRCRLLLLPYDAPLDDAARNAIAAFARHGAVLAIGGTCGLDAVFGVRSFSTLAEGYGRVAEVDPITRGVTSTLHCWNIREVRAEPGTRTLLCADAPDAS